MIIITGLGRCGTTFMTLLFKELGYGMGSGLKLYEESRAGMELPAACKINKDIHNQREKDSIRERILCIDEEEDVEVWKDPRFTWNPIIVRTWWEVRQDIRLIIMHRRFEDIIESRRKVSIDYHGTDAHFHDPKRAMRLDEFKLDFADFYTEVLALDIPHTMFFYPTFFNEGPTNAYYKILEDARVVMTDKIASRVRFENAWYKIYDKNKVSDFKEES